MKDGDRLRMRVAQEAARIIVEHGIDDFKQAKRKAVERLNLGRQAALPTNLEIESALHDHHALFGGDQHTDAIASLRTAALATMHLLEAYSPRLVGPVLAGTAAGDSAVQLHVFSDNADDVLFFLESEGLNVFASERRYKQRRQSSAAFPTLAFHYRHAAFEVTVFPYDGLRQAPMSPVDARPMARASAAQVQALLETAS